VQAYHSEDLQIPAQLVGEAARAAYGLAARARSFYSCRLAVEESVVAEEQSDNLRDLVAEVAAAYFANSHVTVGEIGTVIEHIAKSLSAVGVSSSTVTAVEEEAPARRLTPAQIRKSITPEALISFEDGKPYKTLRRHLSVKGLSPDQYKEKWGLPKDYPLVAASYSAARSQMAKDLGLGNRRTAAAPTPAPTRRRRATPTS
jgi:predicted transcriptional regulator